MAGITTKDNGELEKAVDMLDGERGTDVTGFEGKILSSILRLDTPEKIQEAAHRMNALSGCNAELQSAHQKNNLLSGISGADIDKMDIFNTIKKLERKKLRIMRFAEVKEKGEKPDQLLARQEILKKHTGLETVRASDILMLKKNGADLTKLLLVPEKDSFAQVSRETLKEGGSFIVNFGENPDVNNIIGAGDMLPPTVGQVKITSKKYPNGIVADRRNAPRPGYYNDSCKPPYIAVYDDDKIEIIKIGEVDEKTLKEATESEDKWLRERRIEDMIDTDGKAITDLPEDKKLEEDAQKEIKQRKEIRESIGTMRKGRFYGTTDKPVSETVKALKDLNMTHTTALLEKTFGEGPATNLLIALDEGTTFAIKREITLAYHEGGLMFGRTNQAAIVDKSTGSIIRNENTGLDIGTFQIHGTSSSDAVKKYESCLQAGIKLASQKGIAVDYEKLKNDPAQRDLIAHLGYIQSQRGGAETFARLRDPSLMDDEVIELMHHDIQGGIDAIGISVVAQVKNTKIDLEQIKAA